MIRIFDHSATHAAGVIGKDAAHHTCVDRGGVRSDTATMRLERHVNESAHNAGLKANMFCVIFDAIPAPVLGNVHEDAIRHCLTGETRSRRTKGHRDFILLCEFEKGLNLADGIGLYHRLRHQPKIRRVIGIRNAVNEAGMNTGRQNDLGELRGNIHTVIVHFFEKVSSTIWRMPKPYVVPLTEIRREHVIVNSRFVATLAPIFNTEEARAFITRIKKEFADASHNVPAYIIGGGHTITEFCSDDGEPAGTSGKPALAVLRGSGLGDVAVVITRYFGGTLLGTGGLVKAYTESTQLVVNAVERGRRIEVYIALLVIPYNLLERLRLMVVRRSGEMLDEDFAGDITLTLQFPVESFEGFQKELQELSAGRLKAEVIEKKETIVKLI